MPPSPSPRALAGPPRDAGRPRALEAQRTAERDQAEARFRAIVEACPTPLLISRLADGAILYANERLEALIGAAPGSLVGRTTPDFYADPADRRRVLAAVHADGEVRDLELAVRRADGALRWVSLTVQRLTFDGAPALATALLDVTERAATARALHERTAELEAVFRGLPDLYFRMRADGTIVDYRAGRQFGLYVPPEVFLGRRVQDVLPPPVSTQTAEALAELARTGEPVGFEYTLPLGDERRDFEARLLPLADVPDGVVAVVRDVTERTRAEEAVRYQAALLAAQGEASPDGALVVGADGRILSHNRRFAELWGLPPEVLAEGSDADALAAVLGRVEDPDAFRARVADLYADPDAVARDEVRLADGGVLDRYSAPVRGADGARYGRLWFFRDVTAERRHAADLEAARRAAEAALADLRRAQDRLVQQEKLASLGALTAGIAHEIRNPLTFVTGFAALSRELLDELAEAGDPDDRAALLADLRDNAAKIEAHGRRADAIVRAMMDHAQGGTGDRRRVALNALVEDAARRALLAARARHPGADATLALDLGADVGEVEAGPRELDRVVVNLVDNALAAVRERAEAETAAGATGYAPTVTVSTRRAPGAVEVRVADDGAGMAEAVRARVFEPFFTTKPPGEGTGLGLSLSHDIVTRGHGGTLTVTSEEGVGTTFVVRLPAA